MVLLTDLILLREVYEDNIEVDKNKVVNEDLPLMIKD